MGESRWKVAWESCEVFSLSRILATPRVQDSPIWIHTPGSQMSKNYAIIIQFVLPLTFYPSGAQKSNVYKRDVFVTSWQFHIHTWQPQCQDHLPETSGTLWIHLGALTNQRCSLATGCGIIAWWHHTITWTNVDFSLLKLSPIHPRAILQQATMLPFHIMSLSLLSILVPHFSVANKLKLYFQWCWLLISFFLCSENTLENYL